MEDEFLLQMLEKAIKDAANSLLLTKRLKPFAQALKYDNSIINFSSDEVDHNEGYENLWQRLHKEVKAGEIKAVILLQDGLLPEQFHMSQTKSIRIHIESKDNLDQKLGARFLYVPYEKDLEKEGMKLFNPKPIAFAHEIFKI